MSQPFTLFYSQICIIFHCLVLLLINKPNVKTASSQKEGGGALILHTKIQHSRSGDPIFCLHISSSWVEIRLHTEFHPSRLPGSALKFIWVVGGPTNNFVTPNSELG